MSWNYLPTPVIWIILVNKSIVFRNLLVSQNSPANRRKGGSAPDRWVPGADVWVHLPVSDPWPPNSSSLQGREGATYNPTGPSLQHLVQVHRHHREGSESFTDFDIQMQHIRGKTTTKNCNVIFTSECWIYCSILMCEDKWKYLRSEIETTIINEVTNVCSLHAGIQNLQREFSQKVPVDQTASLPHLLHQKIHQEQLFCGEEPNNRELPDHVSDVHEL